MESPVHKYKSVLHKRKLFFYEIENHNKAPLCKGMYVICGLISGIEEILYVGRSHCLHRRLYCHNVIRDLKKQGVTKRRVFVFPYSSPDINTMESILITILMPKINKIIT